MGQVFSSTSDAPNALRVYQRMPLSFAPYVHNICFDQDDNVVVSVDDGKGGASVCAYDQSGALVRTVGTGREYARPTACIVDSGGRLFVADWDAKGIAVFGADGSFERAIGTGQIRGAHGLALSVDESVLYVASFCDFVVKEFRAHSGEFVRDFGREHLRGPMGVAVLSNGHIAVSGGNPGVVRVFAADGTLNRSFGAEELLLPHQIAVDAADNLYVVNHGHAVVSVFKADGQLIGRVDCCKFFDDKSHPRVSIAIDSAGRLAMRNQKELLLLTSQSP